VEIGDRRSRFCSIEPTNMLFSFCLELGGKSPAPAARREYAGDFVGATRRRPARGLTPLWAVSPREGCNADFSPATARFPPTEARS
jgi:hypothetical protein